MTLYTIYHPQGFYMCDIDIRDNDSSFNKVQVNDPETESYNPIFPRWIKHPVSDSDVNSGSGDANLKSGLLL